MSATWFATTLCSGLSKPTTSMAEARLEPRPAIVIAINGDRARAGALSSEYPSRMILNRQRRVRVPVRALDEFVRETCRVLRLPPQAFTVCLVPDSEMACWNRAYRGKNGPTDVLSFPADGLPAKPRSRQVAPRSAVAPARKTMNGSPSSPEMNTLAILPSLRLWPSAMLAATSEHSVTRCAC